MTIGQRVAAAKARFADAGILPEEAALDAELLARHVLGWDRATFVTRQREPFPETAAAAFESVVRRRASREPVAYIRGVQEFWGREFLVNSAVLIPRPETEFIIEEALEHLGTAVPGHAGIRVVDVGTGSGCLAVTLAAERPALHVVATDISENALEVARANAVRFGVDGRVTFIAGAYLAGVAPPIDLVVSNPPYVAETDEPGMVPEVRDHEPHTALFGGVDGLRDVRAILDQCAERLSPGGLLLMEIGFGQARAVKAEVSKRTQLRLLRLGEDLQRIPRVAVISHA